MRKSTTETCVMPSEISGRETVKKTSVFEWHEQVVVGQKNVKEVESSGSQ